MEKEIHEDIHKKVFIRKKTRMDWLRLSANQILALEEKGGI